MLTALERKLLAGSVVRGKIDFSYLPVVGTKTVCLLECLLSRAAMTISFKESYRITPCLC